MTDFVDATDPADVEAVLAKALASLGEAGVLEQLAAVPDLYVEQPRRGGFFRRPMPALVAYGDRRLVVANQGAVLEHLVGGVVLARDPITRVALPGTLASLVCRAVAGSGARDDVSVLLTALRDAVEI